jgi:hypothetical protein
MAPTQNEDTIYQETLTTIKENLKEPNEPEPSCCCRVSSGLRIYYACAYACGIAGSWNAVIYFDFSYFWSIILFACNIFCGLVSLIILVILYSRNIIALKASGVLTGAMAFIGTFCVADGIVNDDLLTRYGIGDNVELGGIYIAYYITALVFIIQLCPIFYLRRYWKYLERESAKPIIV